MKLALLVLFALLCAIDERWFLVAIPLGIFTFIHYMP